MNLTPPTVTDHEAILLLRQDVKALKDSQDIFHIDMKESFKDLKDNYANRLETLEKSQRDADNRFIVKEIQDKKNEDFGDNIESLQVWKSWTLGFGIGLTCLISLAGFLIWYIFTSHVADTIKSIDSLQTLIVNHINQTSSPLLKN